MDIYLLRHGIAAERSPARFPDDDLRPLNARGREQVRKIARAMQRLELGIDLILSSPLLRARQTAEAAAKGLDLKDRVQIEELLAPGGDFAELVSAIAELHPMPANLLLVGHEPHLSGLLSFLSSGRPNLRAELKKGGLARLAVRGKISFEPRATLKWLLPPRLLVMLG